MGNVAETLQDLRNKGKTPTSTTRSVCSSKEHSAAWYKNSTDLFRGDTLDLMAHLAFSPDLSFVGVAYKRKLLREINNMSASYTFHGQKLFHFHFVIHHFSCCLTFIYLSRSRDTEYWSYSYWKCSFASLEEITFENIFKHRNMNAALMSIPLQFCTIIFALQFFSIALAHFSKQS